MKILMIAGAALLLAGCTSTNMFNSTTIEVIAPPENLYVCRQLRSLPDPDTATNQDVAETIERLYRYNRECGINMRSIEEFVTKAQASIAAREAEANEE